ncbi:MAG: Hsp20/alpha crystallin family protein [Burkholderiales bacterium]|jgi:HSP20 family protein
MNSRELRSWMWAEALAMFDEAERLQRRFFRAGRETAQATWEPPIDVIETAGTLVLQIALPGVAEESIVLVDEPGAITICALRPFLAGAGSGARIHRVEIPYGRFSRRVPLPNHLLELADRHYADGCLTLTFAKRTKETQ